MARDFNGSTDRIDYANVFDPKDDDFSCSMWVYADVTNQNQYLLTIHNATDTLQGLVCWNAGGTNDGEVMMQRATTGADYQQGRWGAGDLGTGVWTHLFFESGSSGLPADMECYVDNVIPPSEFEGGGPSERVHSGSWSIGGRIQNNTRNFNGRVAELGVWDRLMTADERNALAKAFSPLFFRRGLRYYTKLLGRKDIDIVSGKTPTYDGTTVIEQPRIFYPG